MPARAITIEPDSPDNLKRTHLVRVDVSAALFRYFSDHPAEMKTMDRIRFEELIAEIFRKFGFDVELTKKTRDGGNDVIAVRRRELAERDLIQCKRPDVGNKIGVSLVRELLGVKSDDPSTKAILATTSYFTDPARLMVERSQWILEGRDYDGVVDWLMLANGL